MENVNEEDNLELGDGSSTSTLTDSLHSRTFTNIYQLRGTDYLKQGWVAKSRGSRINLLKTKWARRYIILKQILTHKGVDHYLEIYKEEEDIYPKKVINLLHCHRIDSYIQLKKSSDIDTTIHKWIFSIHIKRKREIFFSVPSEVEMVRWVHLISNVCELLQDPNTSKKINEKKQSRKGSGKESNFEIEQKYINELENINENDFHVKDSYEPTFKKQNNGNKINSGLPPHMQNKSSTFSPIFKKRNNSASSIHSAPFEFGHYSADNTLSKSGSIMKHPDRISLHSDRFCDKYASEFSRGFTEMVRLSQKNVNNQNNSNYNTMKSSCSTPSSHYITSPSSQRLPRKNPLANNPSLGRSISILSTSDTSTIPRLSRNNSIIQETSSLNTNPDNDVTNWLYEYEPIDSASEDNNSGRASRVLIPVKSFLHNSRTNNGSIKSPTPSSIDFSFNTNTLDNQGTLSSTSGSIVPPVDRSKKPNRRKKSSDSSLQDYSINIDHQFTYPTKISTFPNSTTQMLNYPPNYFSVRPREIIHHGKRYKFTGSCVPPPKTIFQISPPHSIINDAEYWNQIIAPNPLVSHVVRQTVKEQIITTGPKESPAAAIARMKKLKKEEKMREKERKRLEELSYNFDEEIPELLDYQYVDTAKTKAMGQTINEEERKRDT
uniref:Multisubstrate adaptor protein SOC-1 (inferred by orthology to a C. elegans protein) n=1 Tax=Strongyloides venezuelensis TaxID=75913 RepID=A0A0K0FN98_STRVS